LELESELAAKVLPFGALNVSILRDLCGQKVPANGRKMPTHGLYAIATKHASPQGLDHSAQHFSAGRSFFQAMRPARLLLERRSTGRGAKLTEPVLLTTRDEVIRLRPELSAIHLGKPQLNSSTSDGTASTDDASTDEDNRRNRQAPNSTPADNNPDQRNNVVHRTPVSESGTR
jgi:hypothetical protein